MNTGRPTIDEQWSQIETILDRLYDLPPGYDRHAELERLCAGSNELLDRVTGLLEAGDDADEPAGSRLSGISSSLINDLESFLATEDDQQADGRRIGAYRLNHVLGRGGMGIVYVAERADEHYRKRVAIKLMPQGLETPEMIRRFLNERQILANLEHPNIARLLDGGLTDEGYPYLVMEYIEGEPIDEYCERLDLPIRQRLELMMTVCAAVQHAHQNMVIHRDLKPNNILVTTGGEVRLLDFGVAKLADPELSSEESSRTLMQPRTPGYASPEQEANRAVSTASDVYSLGVILYRLLTEQMPLEVSAAVSAETGSPRRDQTPVLPSVAASDRLARESRLAAGLRASFIRRIRGDLDNIVLKALEFEPENRYPTPAHLAEDIRRHLRGLPVSATNASPLYRLRKFVSRYRIGVATGLVTSVAVALAVAGIVWQARKATQEAHRARQVSEVITGLFTDANPYSGQGRELSVVELLDRGLERLRNDLEGDSEMKSDLTEVIARAYSGQGLYEKAEELHRQNLEARTVLFGPSDVRTAVSATNLAAALLNQGSYDAAEPLLDDAIEVLQSQEGAATEELSDALMYMGNLKAMTGKYADSARHHERSISLRRSLSTKEVFGVAVELSNLSTAVEHLGQVERGVDLLREALEIADSTVGEDHPSTAAIRNKLAVRLHAQGDYDDSEKLYRDSLEIQRRKLGEDHPAVADAALNLGKLLLDKGDYPGAEPLIEQAVALSRQSFGEEHISRIAAEMNQASLWRETGRNDDADRLYRSGLSRLLRVVSPQDYAIGRMYSLMAMNDQARGDLMSARRRYEAALEIQRVASYRKLHLAESLVGLAAVSSDLGEPVAAEDWARKALEIYETLMPEGNWQLAEARVELGAALWLQGRNDEAAKLIYDGYRTLESVRVEGDRRLERARRFVALVGQEVGLGQS